MFPPASCYILSDPYSPSPTFPQPHVAPPPPPHPMVYSWSVPCSPSPVFPRPMFHSGSAHVLSAPCSILGQPMFSPPHVPFGVSPCSLSPMFHSGSAHVLSAPCSIRGQPHPCPLSSMFPQPYVPSALCSPRPMLHSG